MYFFFFYKQDYVKVRFSMTCTASNQARDKFCRRDNFRDNKNAQNTRISRDYSILHIFMSAEKKAFGRHIANNQRTSFRS